MAEYIYRTALQNYIDEMSSIDDNELIADARAKAIDEFAKSLNERLEEEAEEHKKYWQEFGDEDSFGGMNATMRAIEIVNQLAGESKNKYVRTDEVGIQRVHRNI